MKYGVITQKARYTSGMAGKKPKVPVDFNKLEEKAKAFLSKKAFAYVAGGAGTEKTIKANQTVFDEYQFKCPMMQSTPSVDLQISLFGKRYDTPLLAAPIGVLDLAFKDGDLAVARACSKLCIPMIFSNQASSPMEECSRIMANGPRWFQLYWSKSDKLVQSLVERAERCNCEAIVVTLDTTSLGWRPRDLDLGYLPFLHGKGIAQYSSDPIFQEIVRKNQGKTNNDNNSKPPVNLTTVWNLLKLCHHYPGSFWNNLRSGRALTAVKTFIDIYMRPELRWEDLKRLRAMTSLPVIVKGIQTAADARLAFDHGVNGIIVSNHGGRQIDGGVGALTCLDEIIQELGSDKTVLFDSGIRSGADVIKALALGANAVLIGRPFVYGLAIDGQSGVEAVLINFLAEIELQLSLMGVDSVVKLDRKYLM